MKIIKDNGLIKVMSDYNKEFIRKAHEISGRWEMPYWVFDEKNEAVLRNILMEIYGEDGTPQKEVTVDIDLDKYYHSDYKSNNDEAIFHGKSLCYRPGRDSCVRMQNDAIVVAGGFPHRGGSVKYPCLNWNDGTVIRVTVPETVYLAEKDKDGVTLYESADKAQKVKALEDEKERLTARIAEIDAEIALIQ